MTRLEMNNFCNLEIQVIKQGDHGHLFCSALQFPASRRRLRLLAEVAQALNEREQAEDKVGNGKRLEVEQMSLFYTELLAIVNRILGARNQTILASWNRLFVFSKSSHRPRKRVKTLAIRLTKSWMQCILSGQIWRSRFQGFCKRAFARWIDVNVG